MFMDSGEDELTLRTHIHKLLFHYSLKYITTNYVTHTRSEVSELLSEYLETVPTEDPGSLVVPKEPFEALSQTLQLNKLEPYEQKCETSVEAKNFIKCAIFGSPRRPRTNACWEIDETPHVNRDRPMSPILTLRAMRQTPRLGVASLAPSHSSLKGFGPRFLAQNNLKTVHNEPILDVEIMARERDYLLGLRPKMDAETHNAISSILRQVPTALPQLKTSSHDLATQVPPMVATFLSGVITPPVTLEHLISPPLFPRHVGQIDVLEKLSDIPTLHLVPKVKVDEDEEDLSTANMLLVDGWNVIAPLPASQDSSDTPSLEDGSGSSSAQNDELFALTPPQNFVPRNPKMDEYLIPRSRKPRGGLKETTGEQQSLAVFLPSLIPEAPISFLPGRSQNSPPDGQPHTSPLPRPPYSTSNVNLGNPSERPPCERDAMDAEALHVPELDSLIAGLCKPLEGQTAEDWILNERMDEKEALMMDVPKLTEPNQHSLSPSCPTMPYSLHALLAANRTPNKSTVAVDPQPTVACFKKVSGLQSLNIDLTWRPFNFGTSVPRTEELADVERLPTFGIESSREDETKLQGLLSGLDTSNIEQGTGRNIPDDASIEWKNILGDSSAGESILTRAERRRLAAREVENEPIDVMEMYDDADSAPPNFVSGTLGTPTRPHQKRKLNPHNDSEPVGFLAPDTAPNAFRTLPFASELDTLPKPFQPPSLEQTFAVQFAHGVTSKPNDTFWHVEQHIPGVNTTDLPYHPDRPSNDFANSQPLELRAGESQVPSNYDHQEINTIDCPDIESYALPLVAKVFPVPQDFGIPHNSSLVRSSLHQPQAAHRQAALPSRSLRAETSSARQTLSNFMTLRGKAPHEAKDRSASSPVPEPEARISLPPSPQRGVPDDLKDADTLNIPPDWTAPTSRHRYIASLDLIQKRVLARNLSFVDCNVELVERETSGVDLITDIDTALLFVPLAPLPTTCETLATKLAELSWSFSRLVIVFEGFFSSLSYRPAKEEAGKTDLTPYAYSPAVVKAIKKLKRILKISAAMVTSDSRATSTILYGYASNPGEAARFARLVGDMPMAGILDPHEYAREWLTDDFDEDEMDLARVKGMNAFAASMILNCVDLNTFLALEPSDRVQMFSEMVGESRMFIFNEEMAKRTANVAVSSPPLSPVAQTVISSSKPYVEHVEDVEYQGRPDLEGEMRGDYSYSVERRHGDALDWQTTGLLVVPKR